MMLGLPEKLSKENKFLFPSESVDSPSELSIADDGFSDDDYDEEENAVLASFVGEPLQASSPSPASGFEGEGDGHSLLRSVLTNHLSPIHRSFGNHHINCNRMETPMPPSSLDKLLTDLKEKPDGDDAQFEIKKQKHYSPRQQILLTQKIEGMNDAEVKELLAKLLVDNLGLRNELRSKDKRIVAYKGQMLAILDWKVQEQTGVGDDEKIRKDAKQRLSTPSLSSSSKHNLKICNCRSEMASLHIGGGDCDGGNSGSTIPLDRKGSSANLPRLSTTASSQGIQEVTVMEEVYGMRRSLSFFQEFASSIEVDQEVLRTKIKDGCYLTNQLLIGGVSGWMTAIFLKKFGKIALSAAGGGLLLLAYTTRKGYVKVNYDSIYTEISRLCDETLDVEPISSEDEESSKDEKEKIEGVQSPKSEAILGKTKSSSSQDSCCWSLEKVRSARKWVSSHTYTVGGFVLSFIYNIV